MGSVDWNFAGLFSNGVSLTVALRMGSVDWNNTDGETLVKVEVALRMGSVDWNLK